VRHLAARVAPRPGRPLLAGLVLLGAAIAFAGCGGSGTTTATTAASTTSSQAPGTTTAVGSRPAPKGGARQRAGSGGPSASGCVAAWNRTGPAPSLKNVLLPIARTSGPFAAELGSASGRCALVVHATGVEGEAKITYEVAQRSDRRFVQAAVPALGGSAAAATLERDGKLKLRR
jgi:hypothetical protein